MKTFTGTIVSAKMQNAVVVEIKFLRPHPLYKKILKRKKRIKAMLDGQKAVVGSRVKIGETRPISRDIHFKVVEVLPNL